jgi:DNA-binding transcriptional ArsR family regulator
MRSGVLLPLCCASGAGAIMGMQSSQRRQERLHGVLKALGEPQRMAILRLVHEQELPAGEIAHQFKTTRQAISQHLRLLTDVGLLEQRREGTKRLYRVHKQAFGELHTFLEVFWANRLSVLKRQVETRKGAKRGGG